MMSVTPILKKCVLGDRKWKLAKETVLPSTGGDLNIHGHDGALCQSDLLKDV